MREKALVRGTKLTEGWFLPSLLSQEAVSTFWSPAAPRRLLLFSYSCNCMLELEHTVLPQESAWKRQRGRERGRKARHMVAWLKLHGTSIALVHRWRFGLSTFFSPLSVSRLLSALHASCWFIFFNSLWFSICFWPAPGILVLWHLMCILYLFLFSLFAVSLSPSRSDTFFSPFSPHFSLNAQTESNKKKTRKTRTNLFIDTRLPSSSSKSVLHWTPHTSEV